MTEGGRFSTFSRSWLVNFPIHSTICQHQSVPVTTLIFSPGSSGQVTRRIRLINGILPFRESLHFDRRKGRRGGGLHPLRVCKPRSKVPLLCPCSLSHSKEVLSVQSPVTNSKIWGKGIRLLIELGRKTS